MKLPWIIIYFANTGTLNVSALGGEMVKVLPGTDSPGYLRPAESWPKASDEMAGFQQDIQSSMFRLWQRLRAAGGRVYLD